MFQDISALELHGANFTTATRFPIFGSFAQNGGGVNASVFYGSIVTLTEQEKSHMFIFGEDFVNDNVRVVGDGLEAIYDAGGAGRIDRPD